MVMNRKEIGELRYTNCKTALVPTFDPTEILRSISENRECISSSKASGNKENPGTSLGKEHVFKEIWERTLDPGSGITGAVAKIPNAVAVDWHLWPPPPPLLPEGLKIPVEFVKQRGLAVCPGGTVRSTTAVTETQPVKQSDRGFFQTLKGALNVPRSRNLTVSPPSLLFLQSKAGQFYSVNIKVRNEGNTSRKIKVIPPLNQCFKILTNRMEENNLPPGLATNLTVQYKPTSNKPVSDVLIISALGDGAVTVPLLTALTTPPILQMEEWNCGVTTVGNARTQRFPTLNIGSEARFWILTENEFHSEYVDTSRWSTEVKIRQRETNNPGIQPIYSFKENHHFNKIDESAKTLVTRNILPRTFFYYPAAFRLRKNQKIDITLTYVPRNADIHYEKLVVLSDNGEVRWIAVKGEALEPTSERLLDLKGDFRAPPCDLISDFKAKYSLDFGDILKSEPKALTFEMTNKTTIPLYYFWSVRPISSEEKPQRQSICKSQVLHRYYEKSIDLRGCSDEKQGSFGYFTGLTVSPAQGLLDKGEETQITITTTGTGQLGYHACVISVFVEQVDEKTKAAIQPILRALNFGNQNKTPINYDDLNESMPKKRSLKLKNSKTIAAHEQQQPFYYMTEKITGKSDPTMKLSEFRTGNAESIQAKETLESTPNIVVENIGANLSEEIPGEDPMPTPETTSRPISGKSQEFDKDLEYFYLTDCYAGDQQNYGCWEVPSWFKQNAPLKPVVELEVWMRGTKLNCWFHPPILKGFATVRGTLKRSFSFHNRTPHDVTVSLSNIVNEVTMVTCEPEWFKVRSYHRYVFKVNVEFKKHGRMTEPLQAKIFLPFKEVDICVPVELEGVGPSMEVLTPVVNFGIIPAKSKKTKTIAIRNSGNRKASWRARISPTGIAHEDGTNLSPQQSKIIESQMIRVWPDWGILEPGEMLGIQVFLFAEVPEGISTSIEIIDEDREEETFVVTVLAEIQAPMMTLMLNSILMCREQLKKKGDCQEVKVPIKNLSGFFTSFTWQNPIGDFCHHYSCKMEPNMSVVPPNKPIHCSLCISCLMSSPPTTLYMPCCVEGMEEPLLLKIEIQ